MKTKAVTVLSKVISPTISDGKDIAIKLKERFSGVPENVRCNCGHTRKKHFNGEGYCHGGGNCGCTWYFPNDKWILMNNDRKKLHKEK